MAMKKKYDADGGKVGGYRSSWRFARISARKARLLVDLIRNRPLEEATNLLAFSKKRGAVMVAKVLNCAAANADMKEADMTALYVAESFCDDGPITKRMQPKDRGKSYTIFKRTCHITVVLKDGAPPEKAGRVRKQRKMATSA